jgi:hypothetical protein
MVAIFSVDARGQVALRMRLHKSDNVLKGGKLLGERPVYYLVNSLNEVDFHSCSGEFIARFSLSQFLLRVDKSTYDVSKVFLQVVPLTERAFLL